MHRLSVVTRVENLAEGIKSYWLALDSDLNAEPGQFIMVWIPGVGEIPIAVAYEENKKLRLVIARRGKTSNYIHENLVKGDRVFIRGPYGNGYIYSNVRRALLVGGGYGASSLLFLASKLVNRGGKATVILGFRNKSKVILVKDFTEIGADVIVCTDDGSYGIKGLASEVAEEIMDDFDAVYTCGPEIMMTKVVHYALSKGRSVQASLERIIKCASGVCGSCVLEPQGLLVCRDGPVFDGEILIKTEDFGRYWLDKTGRRIDISRLKN